MGIFMSLSNGAVFHLSAAHIQHALDNLAANDTDIATAIQQWGYPQERRSPGGFPALLRIIVGQQLSVKAASTIAGRLDQAMGHDITPDRLLSLDEDTMRGAGLSRSKVLYCRSLAHEVATGRLDPDSLHHLDDEEVSARITACKGMGPWSARMYLMFSLGRPDIWPADDLGVREGVRRIRGLDERPSQPETHELGAVWAPYRSAAALLCWHILNNTPT